MTKEDILRGLFSHNTDHSEQHAEYVRSRDNPLFYWSDYFFRTAIRTTDWTNSEVQAPAYRLGRIPVGVPGRRLEVHTRSADLGPRQS